VRIYALGRGAGDRRTRLACVGEPASGGQLTATRCWLNSWLYFQIGQYLLKNTHRRAENDFQTRPWPMATWTGQLRFCATAVRHVWLAGDLVHLGCKDPGNRPLSSSAGNYPCPYKFLNSDCFFELFGRLFCIARPNEHKTTISIATSHSGKWLHLRMLYIRSKKYRTSRI
jgi:hypothetical protein